LGGASPLATMSENWGLLTQSSLLESKLPDSSHWEVSVNPGGRLPLGIMKLYGLLHPLAVTVLL
jgi:hypothetical protein